jgi:signal transduction histidine kinase
VSSAPTVALVRRSLALPVADLLLAGGLAVLAEIEVWAGDFRGPRVVGAVVAPAAAAALAWRRAHPLETLAAVVAALAGMALAYGTSDASTSVFILVVAIYSAAAYGSRPIAAAGLVAVAAAVIDLRHPGPSTVGDRLWILILSALVFVAGLATRARQARTTALEAHAEVLEREQDRRAAAAVAEERRRIARELHDIVSHSLGVVVLQAGAAEQVLERDPARALEALRSIRATGQEAIGEMGTLLGLMRDEPTASREPQPSLADLERLVATTRDAGLPVDLAIEGRPLALPAALELSAFRIVQEGLTNALKHAGDARARVTVRYRPDGLEVEVCDDGAGAAGDGPGGRRGLAGIAERVAVFGGSLEAGPRAGGGWALRAALPASLSPSPPR